MSDRRITITNVKQRCSNLNRRMEAHGAGIRYDVSERNGHCVLDRYDQHGVLLSDVTAGSKREIAEFLHAMMVALDDSVWSWE